MTKKPLTVGFAKRVAFRLSHDPIVFCHWCGLPGWGSDMFKRRIGNEVTRWHPRCHVALTKKIHP